MRKAARPRADLRRGVLAALALAALFLAFAAPGVQAQTYTVTNTSDSGVAGDGSLSGEIAAANASPGPDIVDFASGLPGTIALSGTGLQIEDPVDIEGPGPSQLVVSQTSPTHRVIHIELKSTGPVTIAGLHIANGTTSGSGGDIQNDNGGAIGALTLSNCLVTGGTAGESGGGIDSFGAPLILRSSTVSGNKATVGGGGIWVGNPFTIENSTISANGAVGGGGITAEVESGAHSKLVGTTFSGNSAGGDGGGGASLSLDPGTTLNIANSTFAGNSAEGEGGGLSLGSNEESITIEDSTFVGNRATGAGLRAGGLQGYGAASQRLVDTIVAGNAGSSSAPDIAGNWATAFSLIGNPAGAVLTEAVTGSDLLGVDPQLGPLQDNGGPTQTMAPEITSPAVDRGGGGLTTDQRGDPRPVLYPGVPISAAPGANGADIGAYELQAPSPVRPSNLFTFGKVKLNKKKGTATVQVEVPGAGGVILAPTKTVKKDSKAAAAKSTLKLTVKAKGRALESLRSKGRVKVKAKFTFTPSGGEPASKSKSVRLIRKQNVGAGPGTKH
jgi:hypothetical protein